MGKFQDLTGKKFGKLTVIERAENKCGRVAWVCQCDCGNTTIVTANMLNRGDTISCGCYRKYIACENMKKNRQNKYTHGHRKTRLYNIWANMKQRCYNPNNSDYKDYGGRGITICDEWRCSFETFYNWSMAHGYADDLEINRTDNNGNYEPSNCCWSTRKEQTNNTRRNRIIVYNGESHTLAEWSELTNIPYHTLVSRIDILHWSIEKALTTK